MNNKTFLTIILTSLFWVVVWSLNTPETESEQPSETTADLAEKIVGAWEPEDERNIPLEFTRYGTICLGEEGGLASSMLKFNYKVDDNKVIIEGYGLFSSELRVKVSSDGQGDYLEIYDNPQLAGKYRKKDLIKRVAAPKQSAPAKPRQQAKTQQSTTSKVVKQQKVESQAVEPPKPVVAEQPVITRKIDVAEKPTIAKKQVVAEKQIITEEQVAPEKPATPKTINYAEAIVGKWHPVEGAKNPIEITKYGTIIQWHYETVDIRRDYSISGNKMKIGRNIARVEVIQEGNNTYLEIYDVTQYSGKYRKVK